MRDTNECPMHSMNKSCMFNIIWLICLILGDSRPMLLSTNIETNKMYDNAYECLNFNSIYVFVLLLLLFASSYSSRTCSF